MKENNVIIRKVKVDRARSQQEALDATGCIQYTDRTVVMPKGQGDEVEVMFFKLDLSNRNGLISDTNLEKEFELRGLEPADPYSQAVANEVDPNFADDHPNITHWKNTDGNWCYASFDRYYGRRRVIVSCYDNHYCECCWFAGIKKTKK